MRTRWATDGSIVRDENRRIFQAHSADYVGGQLMPEELFLQRLLRDKWGTLDMLDIGVGAGRTALGFAASCRSYVGVDSSDRMIALCRSRVGENEARRFMVIDACDLRALGERLFDLILFSYNGLDCNGHDDRLAILGQVRRRLRPGGLFYFSAHNLRVHPFPFFPPRFSPFRPIASLRQATASLLRQAYVRFANAAIPPDEARRRGWAVLCDAWAHTWTQPMYYILPEHQVEQCRDAGFEVIAVVGRDGNPTEAYGKSDDWWLHYLCRVPAA